MRIGKPFESLLEDVGFSVQGRGPAARDRLWRCQQSVCNNGFLPACTVTIGLAVVHTGDDSVEALIGRADRVLYQAKAAGRNRVGVA